MLKQEGLKFIGPDFQAPVGRKGRLPGFQRVWQVSLLSIASFCGGLQAILLGPTLPMSTGVLFQNLLLVPNHAQMQSIPGPQLCSIKRKSA